VNILIAPDKFKGSLSANEVCDAIKVGILKRYPDAIITSVPLADGGEGIVDVLINLFNGSLRTLTVKGPLFESITSQYGISQDGKTAFIEMAKASGLLLLPKEKRNPLYTTSYGTGELIKDALNQGVRKIILGIGGSATNDAGIGMASALGVDFFDHKKESIKPIGASLLSLHSFTTTHIHPSIKNIDLIALCDVDNPLYGFNGAAFIYGPQKGADEQTVQLLDEGLRNFENVIAKQTGVQANFPGAGAGGGIASGVKVFMNGEIRKGIEYVIEATHLEEKIRAADLIITGEGKIDEQTRSGKVVEAVARLGKQFNKEVIAVCGQLELSDQETKKMGISKVISLTDSSTNHEKAMIHAVKIIQEKLAEYPPFTSSSKSF
jgi:glycerate kinase